MERTGWEGEIVDLLSTERHPGVWHNGGLEAMAFKAEVWVEAVTEGGRRFMTAWREKEEDAARYRQEKSEAAELEKLLSHTEA